MDPNERALCGADLRLTSLFSGAYTIETLAAFKESEFEEFKTRLSPLDERYKHHVGSRQGATWSMPYTGGMVGKYLQFGPYLSAPKDAWITSNIDLQPGFLSVTRSLAGPSGYSTPIQRIEDLSSGGRALLTATHLGTHVHVQSNSATPAYGTPGFDDRFWSRTQGDESLETRLLMVKDAGATVFGTDFRVKQLTNHTLPKTTLPLDLAESALGGTTLVTEQGWTFTAPVVSTNKAGAADITRLTEYSGKGRRLVRRSTLSHLDAVRVVAPLDEAYHQGGVGVGEDWSVSDATAKKNDKVFEVFVHANAVEEAPLGDAVALVEVETAATSTTATDPEFRLALREETTATGREATFNSTTLVADGTRKFALVRLPSSIRLNHRNVLRVTVMHGQGSYVIKRVSVFGTQSLLTTTVPLIGKLTGNKYAASLDGPAETKIVEPKLQGPISFLIPVRRNPWGAPNSVGSFTRTHKTLFNLKLLADGKVVTDQTVDSNVALAFYKARCSSPPPSAINFLESCSVDFSQIKFGAHTMLNAKNVTVELTYGDPAFVRPFVSQASFVVQTAGALPTRLLESTHANIFGTVGPSLGFPFRM